MAKFKDYNKYKTCREASKTCPMGGFCTSCMYAYPGNGIIDGKPESYVDVCTMSKKQAARLHLLMVTAGLFDTTEDVSVYENDGTTPKEAGVSIHEVYGNIDTAVTELHHLEVQYS